MFALGLLSWLYNRPVEGTMTFLAASSPRSPEIMAANKAAFQAGWNYGETTEAFSVQYEVKPATLRPGIYRNITGNSALAFGLVAASRRSGLPLFLGSYPITPASDILHELSKLQAVRRAHVPGRGRDRRGRRRARRRVRRQRSASRPRPGRACA